MVVPRQPRLSLPWLHSHRTSLLLFLSCLLAIQPPITQSTRYIVEEDEDSYRSSLMERSAITERQYHRHDHLHDIMDETLVTDSERSLADLLASLTPSETVIMTEEEASEFPTLEDEDLSGESTLFPTESFQPSEMSSSTPSLTPSLSMAPSRLPSRSPSFSPSISFAPSVSAEPSLSPSISMEPSVSMIPSDIPSDTPSLVPTEWINGDRIDMDNGVFLPGITDKPTVSQQPSGMPTKSSAPSQFPSDFPSQTPSISMSPSSVPSISTSPSTVPSVSMMPSISARPSSLPSSAPSDVPSSLPTLSLMPSGEPSQTPSSFPSLSPSATPSAVPTATPSSSPSTAPSSTPSTSPSSVPSSSPTLFCHDNLDYRSPINGFQCKDHAGTSCLQWRFLGLSMDDLEELVNNCPVSCNIDCGSLTRFDITISYQISRVPGLLDSLTVNDLNTISQEYLSEFVRNKEQTVQFFLENVELLSQTILSRRVRNSVEQEIAQYDDERRNLAEQHVNLWVSVAFRGFAINLSLAKTTEHLVSGIDSLGYSAAIRNSGNGYLEEAYAFSAQERTENSSRPLIEDGNDDGNSVSAVLIVFVVVFVCIGLIASGAFFYHKRSVNGLPCRAFQKQKVVERDVHSPESANVASPFGSMFSFDDTATAATNGLMRFIGSFSRSRESTSSPSSTAQKSTSNDEDDDFFIGDEETGMAQTPQTEGQGQADEEEEEEEEHPLAGLIPPMIVYDHIDTEEEDDEGTGEDAESMPKTKTWGPTVVPSRRVEANENLVLALGNRSRPSTTDQLEEYLSQTSNFVTDPSKIRWMRRLESKRPSPIGIFMDSDDDGNDDDVSVASTPVRLKESELDVHPLRRTRSLDDCSILESVSNIIVSDQDYNANVSPIEPTNGGRACSESPSARVKAMASLSLIPSDSPTAYDMSPDQDPCFTWVRGAREVPDTPTTMRRASSQSQSSKSKHNSIIQEPVGAKNSFWNRSPIAKGVKDAIWSNKRANTPTRRPDITIKKNGFPATASDMRWASGGAPVTPTRTDLHIRRASNGAPSPSPNRPDAHNKRSSTPTRMEMMGIRIPTPTRETLLQRRSSSPATRVSLFSNRSPKSDKNSEHSRNEDRFNLKRKSASFDSGQSSNEEDDEVHFEFRAPRVGKLGLLINSTPETGPIVEQVKDYSTLFGRIRAGDRIIEVDGVETSHMSIKDVTKRLNGKYGIRTATAEVRIKVARIRDRDWDDEESRSNESGSVESFSSASQHRRNRSNPEPLLDRLSLTSMSEHHRLSSYSHSNHSKEGEEV